MSALAAQIEGLEAERDRLRKDLEWVKAAIEQNGDPKSRDDMTQHRQGGALAMIYAGVCVALAPEAAGPPGGEA